MKKQMKGFRYVGYIEKQVNGLFSAFLASGELIAENLESEDEARLFILSHALP